MANKQVIGFEINGINIPLGDVSESIVDSIFDENSVHPVQNKTITEEFSKKANVIIKEVFYEQCFKPSLIDLNKGIEISIQDTSDFDQILIEDIRCGQYDPRESVLLTTDHIMPCNITLGDSIGGFSTTIVFDDEIKNLCKNSSNIGVEIHYTGIFSALSVKGHQAMDLIDVYREHPLKEGDYSNSYILEKGKALSPMSLASGQNADDENSSVVAIAGCKGFYYYSYTNYENSQNIIELSTSQCIAPNLSRTWDDASQALLNSWKDKKINIVGSHKHTMCATVKEILGDGIIITSKLPFGEKIPFTDSYYSGISWGQSSYDWDDGAIYCPELPENGVITFGRGARSIGPGSIAAGTYSVAEGKETLAANDFGHAEGRWTKAGYASHAEGYSTSAIGQGAHSEGHNTNASAHSSHTEGKDSVASGAAAHAEGWGAIASGEASHAEGYQSQSTGKYSHAEGGVSQASGNYSHSEGVRTKATKTGAHSEGELTEANGQYSHAEGKNTITNDLAGHVQGKYNLTTSGYAHVVGNGEANKPSDAHRLDWNGNAWFAGSITMNGNKKLITKTLKITYTDSETPEIIEMVVAE